jgi:hypothetical protein
LKAGLLIQTLNVTLPHGPANAPLENAIIENAAAAVTPNAANFARTIHSSDIKSCSTNVLPSTPTVTLTQFSCQRPGWPFFVMNFDCADRLKRKGVKSSDARMAANRSYDVENVRF